MLTRRVSKVPLAVWRVVGCPYRCSDSFISIVNFNIQELRPVQMTGPQTSEAETNLIPISVGQPIPQGKIILITKPP